MQRQLLSTGSQTEKTYGYSRAVVQGPWVFLAGTVGYDYEAGTTPGDVGEQTRNCWKTIDKYLKEAGASLEDMVRVTFYVTDPAVSETVLQLSAEVLREIRPATTFLVVSALFRPEWKVEIEVTALKSTA